MIEYETEQIPCCQDPVALAARFARSGFGDYIVYENHGEWILAGGSLATIVLDAERIRLHCGGDEHNEQWSGTPGRALQNALDRIPVQGWHAFGRIDFGFSEVVPELRIRGAASPGGELVRLIVPRIEVRLDGRNAVIRGVDAGERAQMRALLTMPVQPGGERARPVNVRGGADEYMERVAQAVKEIRQGQYQKVILSRSVRIPFPVDPVATYELGRRANSPARSFLLELGGAGAAGFSPEVVVTVDRHRSVATQPLAGTRAFGLGTRADAAARSELETDPKEIYEHAVSVRTAVAELQSICAPDSVHVEEFMGIRERGSVQHLASLVRGTLAGGTCGWDAVEAVFPAVTASGIPKRESLDAISRMDEPRGLYSGAVVAASHDGSLDAALVLRAMYQVGGKTWLRAGAGIVAASTPEREFEETCEKLSSVAPYIVAADIEEVA